MDSIPGVISQRDISLSRRKLIELYKSCASKDNTSKFENLAAKIREVTFHESVLPSPIKNVLSKLINQYKTKWQASGRNNSRFQLKNKNWLDTYIHFPQKINLKSAPSGGRPSKSFSDCSERSKRRKTEELRVILGTTELTFAAQMKLRAEGHISAAKIIKDISITGPESAEKYISTVSVQPPITEFSEDKALSLVIGAKLTKFQYNFIRSNALEENCKIYPNYECVTKARKRCYPNNILITETSAEVPLQDLVDHTMKRLWKVQHEVMFALEEKYLGEIWLISKWGCDGTSGQAEYKQCFQEQGASDSSIFVTSLVPVKLVSGDPHGEHLVIWQNQRPSSPRFCRPIRVQFLHETTEILQKEAIYIEDQISRLSPTKINIDDKTLLIKHQLVMTMIDGKAMNAVTNTASTQKCNLCGATAKEFNSLNHCLLKPVNESRLQLGLSSLHCWIRFYEWLLNLSYKLKLGKWQARGIVDKAKVEIEKKRIQEKFQRKLGLLVDKPKHGYGSTNDGNSARRFFSNYETSAEITNINKNLIYRVSIILLTISSGLAIDHNKFKIYTLKTAVLYLKLYPWYNMPTTVHRVLIHGHIIIKHAIMPIGLLSEDAQESKNKDIKMYRKDFTRKFSRIQTMEDLYHNLLASSDPYITSLRKTPIKHSKPYPKEVIMLLKEHEIISNLEKENIETS